MHGSNGGVGGSLTEKFKFLYIYIVKLAKRYLRPPPPASMNIPQTTHWNFFSNFLDLRMNIILAFPQKNN